MERDVSDLIVTAEELAKKLRAEGVKLYADPVAGATPEDLAALGAALGWTLHPDLAALWRRGIDVPQGAGNDDPAVDVGFSFVEASRAAEELQGDHDLYAEHWEARDTAGELEGAERDFAHLLRDGVSLTYENPRLFADREGQIWLVNTSDCVAHKVATTLGAFLETWIAAGLASRAESQEGADAWHARTQPHVPAALQRPVAANAWLQAYGRIFWA